MVKEQIPTKYYAGGFDPVTANPGDAGIDLKYRGPCDFKMYQETVYKIHTGLHVEIPNGRCGIIFERSGLGSKFGVTIHGRVIDGPYRGEIVVLMSKNNLYVVDTNDIEDITNQDTRPCEDLWIRVGDKIAQMVVVDCYPAIQKVENLTDLSTTQRGEKGLGSSGR